MSPTVSVFSFHFPHSLSPALPSVQFQLSAPLSATGDLGLSCPCEGVGRGRKSWAEKGGEVPGAWAVGKRVTAPLQLALFSRGQAVNLVLVSTNRHPERFGYLEGQKGHLSITTGGNRCFRDTLRRPHIYALMPAYLFCMDFSLLVG